jgi:predicted amino acid racemase
MINSGNCSSLEDIDHLRKTYHYVCHSNLGNALLNKTPSKLQKCS